MKIRLLDTFAWVGWFHLALEQSIGKENIECIWYSEIDKFAKQVYNERFPNTPDLWSITELDIDNLSDFDIVTGWFPCQDVSVAGKQSLDWWRTVLVEYLLQILEKKQPKYFVFENVKGLMSKKFDTFRESIFDRMFLAWYEMKYQVLNTKDFWLPQNRERVFMVWRLVPHSWIYQFPKWQELITFLKDILEEEVAKKFYMTDEQYNKLSYDSMKRIYDSIAPTLDTAQGGHRQPKIVTNVNPSGRGMNWNVYRTDTESPTLTTNKWEGIKIVNATSEWYLEALPGDWIILDNPWSKTKRSRVKKWISWTLTCAWSDWVLEKDYRIRKLTPIEYARLQWFPDTWSTDFVSNSQAYKQMWNAISVPVVKAIFDNLFTI